MKPVKKKFKAVKNSVSGFIASHMYYPTVHMVDRVCFDYEFSSMIRRSISKAFKKDLKEKT